MARIVYCLRLKRETEGLNAPPYPGALGERIYENISREAWQQWLVHLSTLLSSYRLSSADPASLAFIEQHMLNFLFGEGDLEAQSAGFRPPSRKK
jgi:Fe-S cluster biosynthesis and repair protein YggX